MNRKESELLDRYAKGDEGAFELIFEEYRTMVFRVAYGLVGKREDALDVSQEVFLRLHKHLKGFKSESSLRTWIYRITLNRALSQLRKRQFLPLFDFLLHKPGESDPLRQAESNESAERLSQALECLSAKQKQAFVLKNQEGLRYAEIAKVLKVKQGTVKAMIYQASNKLKEHLKKEYS